MDAAAVSAAVDNLSPIVVVDLPAPLQVQAPESSGPGAVSASVVVETPTFSLRDGISDDIARIADGVSSQGFKVLGTVRLPWGYVLTTLGAAVAAAYVGARILEAVGVKGDVAAAAAGVLMPMVIDVAQRRAE